MQPTFNLYLPPSITSGRTLFDTVYEALTILRKHFSLRSDIDDEDPLITSSRNGANFLSKNTIANGLEKHLSGLYLASDKDWWVREAVAENPRTPEKELNQLANSSNGEIRKAVVNNPSTSEKTLQFLAKDSDQEVKRLQ